MTPTSKMNDEFEQLVADCLARGLKNDPCAAFDLASLLTTHAEKRSISLMMAAVELLSHMSAQAGCEHAIDFSAERLPQMQEILRKRWARAGMS